MSIWSFVKEAGERIADNARAAVKLHPGQKTEAAKPSAGPASTPTPAKADVDEAGPAIANYIHALELPIDDLKVSFDKTSSTVHVSGVAKDQATKEKVILSCGNVAGVEKVADDITVKEASAAAQYHIVAKGESLSAIAQKYYGAASKYQKIFEANQPMLKHPDKIYPGQTLRIPALS